MYNQNLSDTRIDSFNLWHRLVLAMDVITEDWCLTNPIPNRLYHKLYYSLRNTIIKRKEFL